MTYGKTTALAAVLAAALTAPAIAAGTAQQQGTMQQGTGADRTQTMERGATGTGAAGTGMQTGTGQDTTGAMQTAPAGVTRDWENSRAIDQATFRAEDIIGRDVVNLEGEDVGEVNDVVIANGRDEMFLVVGVGGFLGMGERDVALPVSDLRMSSDNVLLMSQKSEDQLKEMPEFKESDYRKFER